MLNMRSKSYKIVTCIPILIMVNLAFADNFKSVPVTVKALENESVLLPCYVDEETDNVVRVRWYKGGHLLGDSGETHQLLPDRMRMWSNYSLQIDSLKANDTANYMCEVVRAAPSGPIKQVHSIEVHYPPTVRTIPEDGYVEVKKGQLVDIGCDVTGMPVPVVDWRKNGEPIALLEHRQRIRFTAEHRHLAGTYECVVGNGVGDRVKASIRVLIQDAPVVYAEKSFVHTAIGLRASLSAILEFSIPAARTTWYREGRPVRTGDRIKMIIQDKIHQLIFRHVQREDFGNYTFRAENKLGMADVSFRLTGVPNVASFKVENNVNKPSATSFTLVWEVDSYAPIIEYNLWLRPYIGHVAQSDMDPFSTEHPVNLWRKVVVPGDVNDGPIHSALYTVRGLTPSTVYEAMVTSRNSFGWSKPSAVSHFATEPGVTGSRPATSDYSELPTPILEDPEEQSTDTSLAQVSEQTSTYPDSAARDNLSFFAILSCTLTWWTFS